jgi:RNA recognition motif-containing protein
MERKPHEENDQVDRKPDPHAAAAEPNNAAGRRTIFVGNVPISVKLKQLTKLFREYGAILSMRMRSVPLEGSKVDEPGNQRLVRKVRANLRSGMLRA